MPPPRLREFVVEHIASFDDEALCTFLDPRDGGIDPAELGRAIGANRELAGRVARCLPGWAAERFDAARVAPTAPAAARRARRCVLERLFWPLVYWNDPDDYAELVSGEHIHARLLDALDLDDRVVCDIGAGTGRFTLLAATRAARVIAVDAVPALLERLHEGAARAGLENIDIRRGRFSALPVDTGSVDVAVACSSFTSNAPHGGDLALAEAERIVGRGGEVAVIWPQDPEWFRARGFTYLRAQGNDVMHFRDVATAVRLCRRYYSDDAAGWVLAHRRAEVPYSVLGVSPPNDACVKHIAR